MAAYLPLPVPILPPRARLAALCAAVAAATGLGACGEDDPPAPDGVVRFERAERRGAALGDALRTGGHVIVVRHAATDSSDADGHPPVLGDCTTQRNLKARGRAQARAIGAGARAAGIPVGPVLSSPYCRTEETAELAFARADARRDLISLLHPGAPRQRYADALVRRLRTAPPPGRNTVLVTHTFNIEAATPLELEEGEAAAFRAGEEGELVLVGRLRPADWRGLGG